MAIARALLSSRVRGRTSGKFWRQQILQGTEIATPQNKRDRARGRAAPPMTSVRKANRPASTTHSKMVDVALRQFRILPGSPVGGGSRGAFTACRTRFYDFRVRCEKIAVPQRPNARASGPLPKSPLHLVHLAATYRRSAGVFRFSLSARYTNNARFRRCPQTAADLLRVRDRSITRPKAVRRNPAHSLHHLEPVRICSG